VYEPVQGSSRKKRDIICVMNVFKLPAHPQLEIARVPCCLVVLCSSESKDSRVKADRPQVLNAEPEGNTEHEIV
jgi:hypothetical protein